MTHVDEIFPPQDFRDCFSAGYIREQWHPALPLRIFTYTEKAVYDRHWTPATLACRGLIVDMRGNVIARPFPKFFNHGEEADPYEHVASLADGIFDKLDGSLGIAFHDPEPPYTARFIATRGSFASDQAKVANRLLRDKYPDWQWPMGVTPLFEIIYPENRIVLKYFGMEDLVLIGAVGIGTGEIYTADAAALLTKWKGPRATKLNYIDLTRVNREGVVVYHFMSNTLEKYKQADYLALHKLVTNLNARTIYDALSEGKMQAEIIAPLPDEFHDWIADVVLTLQRQRIDAQNVVFHAYETLVSELNLDYGTWQRREFAVRAREWYPTITSELFMLLDGQNERMADSTWRKLRPSADWRP